MRAPPVMRALLAVLLSAVLRAACAGTRAPDFVVVGAGTAGCALAARLCVALPARRFELVERAPPRGRAEDFLVRAPRQMWNAWAAPSVVELFDAEPGPGNAGNVVTVITGNTLGGTSAVNGMQWVVPIAGSVERWGIAGLDTESSRKFYERAFNQVGFAAQTGGLRHRYVGDYIKAAGKAGYPENPDPFDTTSKFDVFENRLAVDANGVRRDSCTAYLDPVINRKCKHNLTLRQGLTVTRILLSKRARTLRARGVEVVPSRDATRNNTFKIFARKEVIVAAGPFGSPKLLQLSGIGPRKLLEKVGVKPRVDLPVGKKTQARPFTAIDCMYTGVPLEPSNNSTLLDSSRSRRQFERGKGGVLGIGSFFANGRDKKNAYTTGTGSFFPAFVDRPIISSNCNGNVKSRGFLKIRDANPFTPPKVQLALFSRQSDVDRTQRCLNRLVNVHKKLPKRFNITFVNPPNGKITQKFIRENGGWAGHYVGGCPVGRVLKPNMKVRGVKGLRVIDTSSLNSIPTSAGPMASCYMVAEYMSEQIANKYK